MKMINLFPSINLNGVKSLNAWVDTPMMDNMLVFFNIGLRQSEQVSMEVNINWIRAFAQFLRLK